MKHKQLYKNILTALVYWGLTVALIIGISLIAINVQGQDCRVKLKDSMTVQVEFDLVPADGLVVYYKRANTMDDLNQQFRKFAVIESHADGVRIKSKFIVEKVLPSGCYLIVVARHKDDKAFPLGHGIGDFICLDYKTEKDRV